MVESLDVESRQIRWKRGEQILPLPREVRWELQGDLRAAGAFFVFAPDFVIRTVPSLPSAPAERTRVFASIRVWRGWAWPVRRLDEALVVFVWLVGGKPVWVWPMAADLRSGPSDDFVAITTVELDAETARGAPAALVLRRGE